ncbi:hypothetical protein IFM89_039937, partial [Coptis chinensis]
VAEKFPYLVQKKLKEGQEVRRVAQQVMHGEDYISLGFLFGARFRIAYVSDVSRFPTNTEHGSFASAVILKTGAGQLDLLILDTLYKTGSHNTHFCLPQTLDAVKRLCPKRALLIGMTHEFDHHKDNQALTEWSRREGIPVELAYDGLRIPIDLKGGILLIDMYSDASGQNSR